MDRLNIKTDTMHNDFSLLQDSIIKTLPKYGKKYGEVVEEFKGCTVSKIGIELSESECILWDYLIGVFLNEEVKKEYLILKKDLVNSLQLSNGRGYKFDKITSMLARLSAQVIKIDYHGEGLRHGEMTAFKKWDKAYNYDTKKVIKSEGFNLLTYQYIKTVEGDEAIKITIPLA